MQAELTGYLNVLKPPEWTSHEVVGRLRRLTGQRRIGHTGTLDPAAIGVLPVALGRATRTVASPAWDTKEYWADVTFGQATDTDDAEGTVVATGDADALSLETIHRVLSQFVGTIHQRPPAYSAVHIDGERAYRQARRGTGQVAPERAVEVFALAVTGWSPSVLSLRVQCGSGTYIRSIARDLGVALGCPAHLSALVRLRVGPFSICDALDMGTLEAIGDQAAWSRVLWPLDVACAGLDALLVARGRTSALERGGSWPVSDPLAPSTTTTVGPVRVYAEDGRLSGLASVHEGRWSPARGLKPAAAAAA